MSDTRFTPGPWSKIHDHPNPTTRASLAYIRAPVDDYGVREEIATVYCCNYGDREQDFNAHLIAAAPELYEATDPFDELHRYHAADAPEWKDSDRVTVQLSIGDLRAIKAARAKARGES